MLTDNSLQRLKVLGAAFALVAAVGAAQAQVSGSLWENYSSPTVGSPPSGTPTITFTANQIDFGNDGNGFSTPYTEGGWLTGNAAGGIPAGTPPTTVSVLTGSSHLADSQTIGNGNTFVELTGGIFLNAGVNSFQVGHDDGVIITVAGATVSAAGNDPGATAFALTPFTITAPSAGMYTYTVDYVESSGAPGALEWAYPNGAPIGTAPDATSTLSLLGIGLSGLAAAARRLKK
jgi:hypothetical protein